MKRLQSRRGFTLVELLAVVAILVLLYGLMLVRLAPTKGGQCRQAANAVATSISEVWSRGLGNPAGGAIVIESAGAVSQSLAAATVPPPIEGWVDGTVGSSVSVRDSTDPAGLANGYRIQFFRTGSGAVPPSPWYGYSNGGISLRASAGQTDDNTILPVPVSGRLQCLVLCRPVKAEQVLTLQKAAAIDLRYSGVEGSGGLASLEGRGDITIMFDGFGGMSGMLLGGAEVPPGPVYLLVAAQSDIDRGGTVSLANATSRWVVILPQTGRISVAPNNPAADVGVARLFARPAASIGR